jgi:RND family efflux transporter MFP subunit
MKRNTLLILISCLALLLAACGKKAEDSKNMEQLYKEQGIPVRVKAVELEIFSQELGYNAPLGGLEESYGQALLAETVASVNARVGDRVSAGQIIVSFPRSTPSAQYEQAQTGFEAARTAYGRMQNLFDEGAVSRQDLDNVETQYKLAQANLNASEKMINVRAPIGGVVTSIAVSPGERTYPGQALFTVSSTNGYKAKLLVADKDVRNLKVGTSATAVWEDVVLKGRVSKIALALDPYMKAVPVEATFPAGGQRVSFGSTARINLQVMSKTDAVVVNREYIVTENGNHYVWVAANNRAVKRQITTGLDNQLQYEVTSGLEPGDLLITEGLNLLSDNALIRVIE